jgi:hypothetical protein
VFTGLIGAATGAAVGAVVTFVGNRLSPQRGAATALLIVGVLGGGFAGGTWGRAVARDRVFQVQAQPARSAAVVVRGATPIDVVSGSVRLSGGVVRELNVTLLGFMLVAGAVVGLLAARGLSVQPRSQGAPAQPGAQAAQGAQAQRQPRRAYPAATPVTN